jgi:hypothetical protein
LQANEATIAGTRSNSIDVITAPFMVIYSVEQLYITAAVTAQPHLHSLAAALLFARNSMDK